jgi:hypothetical protein
MFMNRNLLIGGALTLVAVAGCIPSLNPAYKDENLVFKSQFVGVWSQSNSKAKWNFAKRDDKSYTLTYQDEEGRRGRFIAHLADIEGNLFLDLFPEETKDPANGFYKFHLVPIHTIYLVRQTEPVLKLATIDYRWLDKYLDEHPDEIATSKFDGRKLITAQTADLQKFLVQHKEEFRGDFNLARDDTIEPQAGAK